MSAIMNKPIHKILFGSPGTGKSHRIVSEIIPNYLGIDEFTHPENIIKTVFHPEYTYGDFMGKLVPITMRSGKVEYNFKEGKTIKIIDYKNVPLEFYKNKQLPPKSAKKYRDDLVKQLTYEYALQKTHNISANEFFIPYYYEVVPSDPLGELEPELNLKGITVFRANFSLIQTIYLEENL